MGHLDENETDQLAHIHAGDHLLEGLLAGIDAVHVDVAIELGANKVEGTVVAECTPLGVDQDMGLLVVRLHVEEFRLLDPLHVTGIGAGADN